jgi:hypothetical protein
MSALAPVHADALEYLTERLTEIMDLIAGSMTPEAIQRWLARATQVLSACPNGALEQVFDKAIVTCKWPNEVVAYVVEQCADWQKPIQKHANVLKKVHEAMRA